MMPIWLKRLTVHDLYMYEYEYMSMSIYAELHGWLNVYKYLGSVVVKNSGMTMYG